MPVNVKYMVPLVMLVHHKINTSVDLRSSYYLTIKVDLHEILKLQTCFEEIVILSWSEVMFIVDCVYVYAVFMTSSHPLWLFTSWL